MTPVRLGIVGCGGISHRHARAAAVSSELSIVACCDTRADVAADWARTYGCERSYGDLRELIQSHELDGVLIATWPMQHRDHVLGCLEAGARHVLCEKALATTGAEALEILRAAETARAVVVEAFMYRFHPAILKLDELLAAGEVGRVESVRAAFCLFAPEETSGDDPARDWRQRVEPGGGVPYDLTCYCVDACNRFVDSSPRRVLAVGGQSARYGTINVLQGLIEYEDSRVGIVSSSHTSHFDHELRVSGTSGHVELPVAWRIETPIDVTVSRSGESWGKFSEERHRIAEADPFRLQLEHFAAVVRGHAQPVPTLAESVVTAFTLEALVTSALERRSVDVEVPDGLVRS